MRRLLLLTCSMVVVDTLFYTAIGPLVPLFARTLGLSKAGVDVLSGAFGVGAIAGAVCLATLLLARRTL